MKINMPQFCLGTESLVVEQTMGSGHGRSRLGIEGGEGAGRGGGEGFISPWWKWGLGKVMQSDFL